MGCSVDWFSCIYWLATKLAVTGTWAFQMWILYPEVRFSTLCTLGTLEIFDGTGRGRGRGVFDQDDCWV